MNPTSAPYVPPRHVPVTECAKLMRVALAAAFPTIKFGVTSKSYTGGASVTVRWTDGPTTAQVDPIIRQYTGSTFDAMQDLKEYHTSTLDGERVRYGADSAHTARTHSDAAMILTVGEVAAKYGLPITTRRNARTGHLELADPYTRPWEHSPLTYEQLWWRHWTERSFDRSLA